MKPQLYCANEPSALFHSLHQAHRRQVARAQADQGLEGLGSPMLLLVLFRAEEEGRVCSQREVAKVLRLAPATVAVSLKTLEREGYVRRRTDERDARRNRVSLTDKGRQAVELCGRAFRPVDERMLAGFSPEERQALSGFLRRMIENLGGPPELLSPPPAFSPGPRKEGP